MILYRLSNLLLPHHVRRQEIAFVASCLHILAPAGVFLSSPYGEGLFSSLHFLAYYLFGKALAWQASSAFWKHDVCIISSGFFLALATSVRSNGLASGIIFAHEVCIDALGVFSRRLTLQKLRKLVITCLGGAVVSIGSILPQYLAFQEYCLQGSIGNSLRPWCQQVPPSIYHFVQSHYWYVSQRERLPQLTV